MKKNKNEGISARDVTGFFLILAFFFGLYVRLFPVFKADFPLVDGGMFYKMIRDLQAAHFVLPVFTTYNQAEIPFAYPPLAFYFAGAVNVVTGISLIAIIKWLPVFAGILMLPFFFYFAAQVLESASKAALATLIFVLTPNSYWWNIVGGGLTRSLGMLFFAFTALCAYKMYRSGKPVWVAGTALGGTLAVLTHLQWALQAVIVVVLLWFFWGRNKQGIMNSIIVLIGVLLFTSPWWVIVIRHHGAGVFYLAGQVTHSRWQFWTILFALSFTGEYTPAIAVFALVGLFIHLSRRDYFLPLWAILSLFVDPRGGMPASIFPFSIMAMTAIADGAALQLGGAQRGNEPSDALINSLGTRVGRLFFGFFIILFLYNAYNVSNTLSYQVLGAGELKAMDWARSNTDKDDRFLVLDEQGNPLLSPLTEWFPALAERRSINTIQGTEWLAGSRHYNRQYSLMMDIHQCLYKDVTCLRDLQDQMTDRFDFIVVSSNDQISLLYSLDQSPDFDLVYSSLPIRIYQAKGK